MDAANVTRSQGHNEAHLERELKIRCPRCNGPSIPHHDGKVNPTGKRLCLALLTCPVKTFSLQVTAEQYAEMHEAYLDSRANTN